MHVHIAPVGFTREPILKVISVLPGIDALYLLHTDGDVSHATAEAIRDTVSCMIPRVELRVIPFSDFMGIVSVIYGIYEGTKGRDTRYSVNITGGTNLMAAATCYSSYYIRAKIYYSLNGPGPIDDQVIEITAPKAVDVSGYKDLTKDILRYVLRCRNEGVQVTNTDVASAFGINKQKAGYHIRILVEDGLLEKDSFSERGRVDGRKNALVLTAQGVMIANTIRRRRESQLATSLPWLVSLMDFILLFTLPSTSTPWVLSISPSSSSILRWYEEFCLSTSNLALMPAVVISSPLWVSSRMYPRMSTVLPLMRCRSGVLGVGIHTSCSAADLSGSRST